MAISPGWKAPDFMTDTTMGPIRFHAWGHGCWRIVLTHPAGYSTQSLRAGIRWARTCVQPVRLLGLSPLHSPRLADMPPHPSAITLPAMPDFPVIHDETGHIASLWRGIEVDVGPENPALEEHAAFIIDPDNTVRSTLLHPPATEQDFATVIHVARGFGIDCAPLRHIPRAA
ncbi:peroxiredoxin [Komagataeibacter europaeus]|uniref:Peroxiredoxin n=1 Tax=Komagataeibacter europaeus TaxID=33995 RepID=A0A0M0EHA5_KOMEU|nr:peroxidase [Komagataeibacter europaeus]KON64654.1 peroxiredoxin [Komagataeibacter europaeus]GBQ42936.1 peroxidase [Komagataeibacter europaeus LMG 18890]